MKIYQMSDEELDRRYADLEARLDAGDPDDEEYERISRRMEAIEREQDARAIARCGDDRVLQGLGYDNASEH